MPIKSINNLIFCRNKGGITMNKKKYFHIWIDEDLHAEFKGKVGREKTSMSAVAERLIKQYLAEKPEKVEDNNVR